MMADVACFCGCLYSFHGGAGACPKCGEYATVMTAAAYASAGRSHQHSQPVSVGSEDAGRTNGRELPGNRELVPVPGPASA